YALAAVGKSRTCRAQTDATWSAQQQGTVQAAFQRRHATHHRGLRQLQHSGRRGQAARLRHGEEYLHFAVLAHAEEEAPAARRAGSARKLAAQKSTKLRTLAETCRPPL